MRATLFTAPADNAYIIALDQSTASIASVAQLALARNQISERVIKTTNPRKPLLKLAAEMVAALQAEGGEIAMVVAPCGPGAFTALRVGASIAEALAFSADCPLVGIPTNQALASGCAHNGIIHALIDARREQCYAATYQKEGDALTVLSAPHLLDNDAVAAYCQRPEGAVVGNIDGATLAPNSTLIEPQLPTASLFARHAVALAQRHGLDALPRFALNYVRGGV